MNKKRFGASLMLVVLLVAVTALIGGFMLLWVPSDIKLASAKGEEDALISLLKGMKLGGTIELREAEVNYLLEQYAKGHISSGDFKVNNINCSLGKDTISFHLLGSYHKLKIYFTTSGKLQYNGENIIFTPDSFKLGKLPLPKRLAMKLFSGKLTTSKDKKSLELDKSILPFDLEGLEIKDSKLHVKFKLPIGSKKQAGSSSDESTQNHDKSAGYSGSSKLPKDNVQQSKVEKKEEIISELSSREKKLITMISSLMEKLTEDSSYADSSSFKRDISNIKTAYSVLSAKEKTEVKNAVLSTMDMNLQVLMNSKQAEGLNLQDLINLLSQFGL